MFGEIKKFFTNFGVSLLVDRAFTMLSKHKQDVITWLEDQYIHLVNSLDIGQLVKMGCTMDEAKLLKDDSVKFARSFILVLVQIILSQARFYTDKLIAVIKV